MKNLLLSFFFVCFLFVLTNASGQNYGSGYHTAIGVKGYFGDGSIGGFNVKHFSNSINALEGSLLFKSHFLELEGLYEWHGNITGANGLRWYVGPGAMLGFTTYSTNNSTVFGVKGTVGLDYKFTGAPINIAFDINPTFALAPDTNFDLNAGLAFRFAF
ncbi:MAG: hypothetical protein JWN76_388 [Chitinophagaceae bacterium]|nr:hypothetical protein [Chitinophagaceae bacterium]